LVDQKVFGRRAFALPIEIPLPPRFPAGGIMHCPAFASPDFSYSENFSEGTILIVF